LRRGEENVPLPAKVFDLLLFFASNPGRPLLKNEILSAVWPDTFVEESNLNQNVFLLRKALAPDGDSLIVTLPRRGYQFTADVTPVIELATPGQVIAGQVLARQVLAEAESSVTTSRLIYEEETERVLLRRSPGLVALMALGVILVGAVGWLGWQRWEDHIGGPPVQVVLADLDGGTGDPVLDRSLVEAMRYDLMQSPFVTVLSTAIVRQTLPQMMHKPDDPLPAALARDLCERTGSQAVLHGSVARVGVHFLLNEEATNCVDGSTMAIAKEEAAAREELPRAVDRLAATVRHGLGESRRTIARFGAPLFPVNTGSMEALEAYSQAHLLSQRGKMPDAIGLLERAVELDPKFAAAYLDLANFYANMGDQAHERASVLKAYELRDTAATPTRLYIVAHYHAAITGDLFESLRNYQEWIAVYPRTLQPWVGLLEMNRLLGRHAEAIAAARHAIAMNPRYLTVYYGLALEQMHAGDLAGARATCELAISRGLDGDLIRMDLLRIAWLQHDTALFGKQVAWAAAHPAGSSHVLLNEAQLALTEGRLADARRLLDQMADSLRQQGLPTLATTYLQTIARMYIELGERDEGLRLLHSAAIDPEELDEIVALAESGDTSGANALLREQLAKHPRSTLWNSVYGPEIRAAVALSTHRPADAVAALEPARAFEGTTLDIGVLRARALREQGQAEQAKRQIAAVLAHPEVDPFSDALPLAKRELARTPGGAQ
jgi:DNA-binding winged helix-turn-helix (wHTH) protein/tetratricopeptide (TPR) repeat protein